MISLCAIANDESYISSSGMANPVHLTLFMNMVNRFDRQDVEAYPGPFVSRTRPLFQFQGSGFYNCRFFSNLNLSNCLGSFSSMIIMIKSRLTFEENHFINYRQNSK